MNEDKKEAFLEELTVFEVDADIMECPHDWISSESVERLRKAIDDAVLAELVKGEQLT